VVSSLPVGPWAFKELPANKQRLVHVLHQVQAAKTGRALRRISDGAIRWHYGQLKRLTKAGTEGTGRREATRGSDLDEAVWAHRVAVPKSSRRSGRRTTGGGSWGGARPGSGPKPLFARPMTPAERKKRQRGGGVSGSRKRRN